MNKERHHDGPLGTQPGTLDDPYLENPIEETREELAEARQHRRAERLGGEGAEERSELAEQAREQGATTSPVGETPDDADLATTHPRLIAEQESTRWRQRWEHVQRAFVDDPREAVAEADALVGEIIAELREVFESERAGLEGTWSRGEEVSTETLRRTLQRYRSFFARLLEV